MEEHCVDAAEGEEATVSTNNIPTSNTPKLDSTDIKEESKIWNPMAVDYFCKENHLGISPVLAAGFRLISYEIFELKKTPAPIKLSDVPCPIFDGVRCWRVNCPFAHETINSGTPLSRKKKGKVPVETVQEEIPEKVLINYITNLLEKAIAAVDCIMEVSVTYAKNPWEFYVNCESWGCSLGDDPGKTCSRSILEEKLTDELLQDSHFKTLIYPEYIQFQLVAVMRSKGEKKTFVRGVVQEGTDNESVDNNYIKVQLLDTGEKLRVKRNEICGLPKLYTNYVPVLAYQCSLFGISPLMHEWTDEASQFFKKSILGKKCILIIKKSTTVSEEALPILFEDFGAYEVELRTTCAEPQCTKYHNVAKLLAKYGHGVLWAKNLFHLPSWATGLIPHPGQTKTGYLWPSDQNSN